MISILLFTDIALTQDIYIHCNIKRAIAKETHADEGIPGPKYFQNSTFYSMKVKFDPDSEKLYGETAHHKFLPDIWENNNVYIFKLRVGDGVSKIDPGNTDITDKNKSDKFYTFE
ncbi:MAG: hypothetical protein JW894_11680 [Bacteroidales bacterium]|nr:hypothetical protein [Bacteroidales bacterium]